MNVFDWTIWLVACKLNERNFCVIMDWLYSHIFRRVVCNLKANTECNGTKSILTDQTNVSYSMIVINPSQQTFVHWIKSLLIACVHMTVSVLINLWGLLLSILCRSICCQWIIGAILLKFPVITWTIVNINCYFYDNEPISVWTRTMRGATWSNTENSNILVFR